MKLSEYVQRVMQEKGLSLQAVERNSHRQISFGYVNDILQEKTKNPSVDKLKALAVGLRVDEDEIFRVARGLSIDPSSEDNAAKSSLIQLFGQLPEVAQLELVAIAETLVTFHQKQEQKKGSRMIAKREEPITQDTHQNSDEYVPWPSEALEAPVDPQAVDADTIHDPANPRRPAELIGRAKISDSDADPRSTASESVETADKVKR